MIPNQSPAEPMPGSDAPPPAGPGPEYVKVQAPQRRPIVMYAILAITCGVYALQLFSQAVLGEDYPLLLGMKYDPYILSGEIWRLLSPALLHGSLPHIAFNMYALYSFGRELERFYGHGRFLALYVLAALAGNVASFVLSDVPSVGASTAIYGLLGAEAIFLYANRRIFGERVRPTLNNVILVAAINLVISVMSPRIDLWGHVGGLAGGMLFAALGGPLVQVRGIYPQFHLGDRRTSQEVLRAGLVCGLLFILLAALPFILA